MRLTRLFGRHQGGDGGPEGDDSQDPEAAYGGPAAGADPVTRALRRAGLPGADGWAVEVAEQVRGSRLEHLAGLRLGRDWGARPKQNIEWRVHAGRLAADRSAAKLVEQLLAALVEAVPCTAAEAADRLNRPLPSAGAGGGGEGDSGAVTDGRPVLVSEYNTTAAVNTVWAAAYLADGESGTVQALGALSRRALTEPWSVESVRLRNACINALADAATEEAAELLSALAPFAQTKAQRSQILLAVQLAARSGGRAPSKLAELGVARHGLGDDWRLSVAVHHRSYTLEFMPSGRVSVSEFADAAPEDEHALRVVNKQVRDIEETYAHEVIRLEELLSAQRTWPYADWRRLYLGHPITRAVTCRLVWRLHLPDGRHVEVIPAYRGGLRAMDGRLTGGRTTVSPVAADAAAVLQDATMVELWHPRAATDHSVARWRAAVEGLRPGQPFPQISREYTRRLPPPEETELTDYASREVSAAEFEAALGELRWRFAGSRSVSDAVPARGARDRDRHDRHDRGGRNDRNDRNERGNGHDRSEGTGLCFHEYPDAGLACVLRITRPAPDVVLTDSAWFARIGDKNREPVPLGTPSDLVVSESLRALARLAGTRLSDGDVLDAVPMDDLEDVIADGVPGPEEVEDAAPGLGELTDWNRLG